MMSERTTPESAPRWLACALLLLLTVGCGGPEFVDEPPRVASPAEEEPIGQVGQGGTARLALPGSLEPECLNPYLARCRGSEALVGVTLEAPLVVGPSSEYRPLLAESIPSYESETLGLRPFAVEVRLRAGVNFSDGEPLTSADAKWTYEGAIGLARGGGISPPYAGFGRVERVETPDERTVRLVFGEPYSGWRDLLTAPILPRHVYEGRDPGAIALTNEPVGSGPFLLKARTGEGLSFLETPRYWVEDPPLPNLERLEVSFSGPREIADDLSTGRADFGFFTTPEALPDSGDLLRAAAEPMRVEMLVLNPRRIEERDLREEITRAVDRESIAREVGGALVAGSVVSPGSSAGYEPAWRGYGAADEREEKLRPDAGTEALDIVYPANAGPVREAVVRGVVSDLTAAGFDAEARPAPPEDFHGEVFRRGDFDLALYDGGTLAELEALAPVLPPGVGAGIDETLGVLDTAERSRRAAVAQERLAEEAAVLPLFVWPDAYSWSSALSGPRPGTPYGGLAWNVREWGLFR